MVFMLSFQWLIFFSPNLIDTKIDINIKLVTGAEQDEIKADGEAGTRKGGRMLKWLLVGAPSPQTASVISTDIVTDDPLATICAHKVDRPLQIYAVSRSVSPDSSKEHLQLMKHHYVTCEAINKIWSLLLGSSLMWWKALDCVLFTFLFSVYLIIPSNHMSNTVE
jgi:hypothetical protein